MLKSKAAVGAQAVIRCQLGQRYKCGMLALSVVLGGALLLAACSAPDQHPFEQYSTSMKKADTGLVASLDQATSWSRDDYIGDVLKGKTKLSQTAVLQERSQFALSFGNSTGPIFEQFQEDRGLL